MRPCKRAKSTIQRARVQARPPEQSRASVHVGARAFNEQTFDK